MKKRRHNPGASRSQNSSKLLIQKVTLLNSLRIQPRRTTGKGSKALSSIPCKSRSRNEMERMKLPDFLRTQMKKEKKRGGKSSLGHKGVDKSK